MDTQPLLLRSLCQGCVCLKPEKTLHIPHEHPEIEKDVEVCIPCYNRIRKAIEEDVKLLLCNVGPQILGIQTRASAYDDCAYNDY